MSDAALAAQLTNLAGSVDTFYFLFVGALVFFMQAGFGMLEAGSVRTKNTRNILLKNLLDACVGALIWWAWGFATAVRVPPAHDHDAARVCHLGPHPRHVHTHTPDTHTHTHTPC